PRRIGINVLSFWRNAVAFAFIRRGGWVGSPRRVFLFAAAFFLPPLDVWWRGVRTGRVGQGILFAFLPGVCGGKIRALGLK
ncbi:MAG: hypothetical protein UHL07_02725, partial [Bacteroidaceae bacterium]|nr:hypothetical protein [Bacteroidaceae bacterium]